MHVMGMGTQAKCKKLDPPAARQVMHAVEGQAQLPRLTKKLVLLASNKGPVGTEHGGRAQAEAGGAPAGQAPRG